MNVDKLTYDIRGAAFKVHRALGPGLLESAYETCLVHELRKLNLDVRTQIVLPLIYDNIKIDQGFRLDVLVENRVILELKSVERLAPVHTAQLLTYMRIAKVRLGLLMNFNVQNMQHGIKRHILETAVCKPK